MSDFQLDPKFIAGIDLLRRGGAQTVRIGWDDEEPETVVWFAVGTFKGGKEAAGALDPVEAVMRLCERIIDGSLCIHCGSRAIFDPNPMDTDIDRLLNDMGCVYAWDPELRVFRRGCEGD